MLNTTWITSGTVEPVKPDINDLRGLSRARKILNIWELLNLNIEKPKDSIARKHQEILIEYMYGAEPSDDDFVGFTLKPYVSTVELAKIVSRRLRRRVTEYDVEVVVSFLSVIFPTGNITQGDIVEFRRFFYGYLKKEEPKIYYPNTH